MKELKDDPFYEVLSKYDRCVIAYRLLKGGAPHRGLPSHREAVESAMQREADVCVEDEREAEIRWGKEAADAIVPWTYDMEKAQAVPIGADEFLFVPEAQRRDRNGRVFYDYDCAWENGSGGGRIPYWYAFLEAPHGTGYTPEDFRKANAALFPQGTDALEVYEWTTDWSDFFDDGHEWWGAACWSVYDARMDRYAVLFASSTD